MRKMRSVMLLEAPFGGAGAQPGAEMGPAALRVAGLDAKLAELGLAPERRDLTSDAAARAAQKSMREDARVRRLPEVAAWSGAIADATRSALDSGKTPILLGGDHSMSIGSLIGAAAHWAAQDRPLFTLWIDAHGDFNTPQTSPTGNMHGMVVAAACGEPGFEAALADLSPARIDPARVLMLGLRSVDAEERRLLRDRGITLIDMRRIDEEGVAAPMKRFLAAVEAADAALHVSFDIDALDPSIAPGAGTAAPGGLTYREAHLICEMAHDSGRVFSADLMELNPFLDIRGQSAFALADLAASLFGRRIFEPI